MNFFTVFGVIMFYVCIVIFILAIASSIVKSTERKNQAKDKRRPVIRSIRKLNRRID